MIVNVTDDMDERLADEYKYLVKKYPRVSFNMRDNTGNEEYLFPCESYVTLPANYDVNVIASFKGYLTPNRKFYDLYKDRFNMILVNGCMDAHNYYALDSFNSYEDRIEGICMMYNIYPCGVEGNILNLRKQYERGISQTGYTVHTYGPNKWGSSYQGFCKEANHPNHIKNLEILNKYRFVFAIEPMYHELWSWDWLTERLWNAFKSKTVPIYFGCYNIEQKVPKDLYIDLREFPTVRHLVDYLESFPKQKWIDMTENAYEWYKTCDISKMSDFEELLSSLP